MRRSASNSRVGRFGLRAARRPLMIGLTGSIGMGKSTVAAILSKQGVPVFDADAAVRELQGPGGSLLGAIEKMFPGTTGPQGVERERLGAAVFGNPEALKALEALVHPAVGAMRGTFARRHRARPIIVFDIPLLFETRGERKVDLVMTVSALPWQQRKRVLRRAGMTAARFAQIRKLQMPDHIKRRKSDIILSTVGSKNRTRANLVRLVRYLRATLA